MELRRGLVCFALFFLAVVAHSSEARHSVQRREADSYGSVFGDDAGADETQNDDGNVFSDDGGSEATQNDEGAGTDNEPTVQILTKPETFHILVGRAVRLECKVDDPESAVVSWSAGEGEQKTTLYLSGMALTTNNKKKMYIDTPSHDLIIKDLNFNDSNNYTCQVEQKNKVNVTHTLLVSEPPKITDPETTSTASVDIVTDDTKPRIVTFKASPAAPLEGLSLTLTCETTGTPKPTLMWSRLKKNSLATESLRETDGVFTGDSFIMNNISTDDSGTYYCYAINDIGNDTKHVYVRVLGKPRLHTQRHIINSDIGVEAELKCSSHEGNHRIVWYKDGLQMRYAKDDSRFTEESLQTDEISESTLVVTPQTDEDFGTFTCMSENMYGSHSKSIELVQRPIVEGLRGDGTKLTWVVHSHQKLENVEVTLRRLAEDGDWKALEVPLPDKKRHRYEMIYDLGNNTLQAGEYEVTVKARNTKEWSRVSEPVVIRLESNKELEATIQTASVVGVPKAAFAARPASLVLHSVMMYLLVRMF